MISIEHTIGGASISTKIRPLSEETPINSQLAPNIESFLSMMQKASFCGMEESFGRCLASFLEEMDIYLDDKRISRDDPMDTDIVGEMEEFMNEHLGPKIRKDLKKLGEEE
jgi:hypothetical protein